MQNKKLKVYTVLARSMSILLGRISEINKKQVRRDALFILDAGGGDSVVQRGGYPAVWGIFLWEARVCSFCWGEPARLTHQKTSTPRRRSIFYLFFGEFIDLFFAVILGRRYERGV